MIKRWRLHSSLRGRFHTPFEVAKYSNAIVEKGVEGVIEVQAHVDEAGRVTDATIARVDPPALAAAENSVLKSVQQRRTFYPSSANGKPLNLWLYCLSISSRRSNRFQIPLQTRCKVQNCQQRLTFESREAEALGHALPLSEIVSPSGTLHPE